MIERINEMHFIFCFFLLPYLQIATTHTIEKNIMKFGLISFIVRQNKADYLKASLFFKTFIQMNDGSLHNDRVVRKIGLCVLLLSS